MQTPDDGRRFSGKLDANAERQNEELDHNATQRGLARIVRELRPLLTCKGEFGGRHPLQEMLEGTGSKSAIKRTTLQASSTKIAEGFGKAIASK